MKEAITIETAAVEPLLKRDNARRREGIVHKDGKGAHALVTNQLIPMRK